MTTEDLKKSIIQKINNIDDIRFLRAVKTILESQPERIIQLSDKQKDEIYASQKEIQEGRFITEEQLNEDITKWLKER